MRLLCNLAGKIKFHEKFATPVENLWITLTMGEVANFRILMYYIIRSYFQYCTKGHPCWHGLVLNVE
jgi:hypothetical protein